MISSKEEIVRLLDLQLQEPEFARHIGRCNELIETYLQLDLDEKVAAGLIEEMSEDTDAHRQEEDDNSADGATASTASSTAEGEGSETVAADVEEASDPSEPLQTDELHERMMSLIDQYTNKREQLLETIMNEELQNLKQKKDLLASLRGLIENEENIGKAFRAFNDIRDSWNTTGPVPKKNRHELHHEYSSLTELFYYNINIYKELKEHDLKRNLELKKGVLEQLKELQKQTSLRPLEEGVNLCIDRWNDIGPTSREEWEKLKEEFWSLVKETYNTIRGLHEERREEQLKNLAKKEELVKKVTEIADLELKHIKKWQEKTDEIIAIQQEWKTVGYATRERNEAIWQEFREACDKFFDKKRTFFKSIRAEQDEHAKKKEALIAKAEKLKDSTDWKHTTRELINLQKEWKAIGPAHQRAEQKLWRQFRGTCDHFFNAKKKFFDTLDDRQAENLKAKEAIIAELKAAEMSDDQIKNLELLKSFSTRFNEIDHVPFKDKDRVYKAFSEALDEKYNGLKMERSEREAIQFKSRIEALVENDNEHLLEREARGMRDKMSKLKAEIIQLENNLGFFANSKGADALKKEVEKKIERAKSEVESLERKIRMVNKVG